MSTLFRIGGLKVGTKEKSGEHNRTTKLIVNIFVDIVHLDERVNKQKRV